MKVKKTMPLLLIGVLFVLVPPTRADENEKATEIVEAARRGYVAGVKKLLEKGACLSARRRQIRHLTKRFQALSVSNRFSGITA